MPKSPTHIKDLRPDKRNARRHNPRNVGMIERSLQEVGAARSIVIDEDNNVLAGNGTIEAAGNVDITKLRVVDATGDEIIAVRRTGLTAKQKKSLALYDNRTAELADWDAEELARLQIEMPDALEPMFTQEELDAITDEMLGIEPEPGEAPEPQIDRAEELRAKWQTERGQLWQIGRHRLLCGDCRDASDVSRLLDGERINVAVTSPPYAEQRKYDESSEFKPIPPDEYVEWFAPVSAHVAAHLAADGSWFVNIKPPGQGLDTHLYVFDLVIAHARAWGWYFATEFCWERNGVPKQVVRRFKNQFEPVYQFARGDWKMRPQNVRHASENMVVPIGEGAGDTGRADKQGGNGSMFKPQQIRKHKKGTSAGSRAMSDVQGQNASPGVGRCEGWAYPGNRLPTYTATHEATGHTAAFPVGLPAFFIKAFSDEGDVIYEPFCGSGSTLVASEQENRRGYGIEISPKYCAVILERLAAMGLEPTLINGPS